MARCSVSEYWPIIPALDQRNLFRSSRICCFSTRESSYTTGRLCSPSPDEAHAALGSPNTAGFGTCRFLAEGKGGDEQNSHPSVPPALLMCIRVTLQNPEVQGTNISSPREGLCAAWLCITIWHLLTSLPQLLLQLRAPLCWAELGIEPRVAAKHRVFSLVNSFWVSSRGDHVEELTNAYRAQFGARRRNLTLLLLGFPLSLLTLQTALRAQ